MAVKRHHTTREIAALLRAMFLRVLIEIALNGGRIGSPATAEEIANNLAARTAAGVNVFHVHPRNSGSIESLQPADADRTVAAVRAKVPIIMQLIRPYEQHSPSGSSA